MNALTAPPTGIARATDGVRLRGVGARFDQTRAVHDVDLDIAGGEFVALVGPSGAGKSTLLRIIAGLEPGHAGTLAIGGRDMTGIAARHRNIGFVFQNYALFGHMSVAENVAFGLRVRPRARRPDRAAIAATVAHLLDLVQIGELARRRPAQLSGGQRQRVALARALAIEPALLLLDEPFGALDPLVRKEIRGWLRGLHDRLGLTSILVTHDQGEAMEVADRIVLLRGGAIEQVGTPDTMERAPRTDFVHRFLGERVFFHGTAAGGRVALDDFPGVLLAAPATSLEGPVILSIRPWEIGLSAPPDPMGAEERRSPPTGIVRGHRPAGSFRRIVLALGGREIEALAPATAPEPEMGRRVAVDLARGHVFPRDT